MKKIVTLVFVLLTLLTAAASAESYTQADFEWAEAVQDQSALTLKEQAKYLDIVKQRQRGIALLAMGGADTPFQIAGAAQLAELAQYVNAGDATFVSAHYVMTDDVNLSAYGNWTPIGTIDQPFAGVFDGQNYVVTGLKIDRNEFYQGLFGYVSGTDDAHKAQIKNVAVRDAQIRARTEVGAVVGRYGQFTQGFVEPLENCAMIGGTIQGTSSMGQSSCVGGIVGRACGEIQRCYATGDIIGADNAIDYGGIVGETYKAVKACYWTGRLSALGSYADDFGGIVGTARGAVTNCYTTGDITGSLDNAATLGSIVGCALDRVTNCYATGSVKGWRAIGGIAGQAYGDTYAHATISGCMALNTSVESNPFYSIGRVAGITGQESVLNDNYAWDGMRVNGQKIPEGQQSVENGADLTYDDTNGLSRQFETIFGGNSAWTYAENGLPTLKNVGGTQSSELPSWMLGSETTFYITTAQQLKRLADEVNAGDSKSDKTYLLANDIDLSGYPNWTPIGRFDPPDDMLPFSGVFDGQGYSITGLKISGNEDARGLFGYTYCSAIRNVVIRNPEIQGGDKVGALVGHQAYSSEGIENCAVIGGKIQGINRAGGLVGNMEESPIKNCYTTCEVAVTFSKAGGIVGAHKVGSGLENCYATGNVSGSEKSGGIAGEARNVERCVALGQTVTGASSHRVLSESNGKLNVYAWSGMKVDGNTVTDGAANNENGADLVCNGGALSTQFSEIFANDDAWTYTENGLPILKAVKGEQSSELPSWMLSSETTIYITTAQQLKQLADEVNAGDNKSGKTYLLANDIDLSVYPNWSPIGTFTPKSSQASYPFSGVFDGQGYSITGLKISGNEDWKGLFGYAYCEAIRNVVIRNPEIEGKDQVGALVGYQAYSNQGIKNCAVIGGKIQGSSHVGGLVGYMEESPIQNCYSTCEVVAMHLYAGGIVGDHHVGASIRNCYATGNISGTYSGGIVGVAQDVERCVALGQTVTGKSSNRVTDSVRISDVYAWSGMKVNGNTVTDGAADNENGEDILVHDGLIYGKNAQIFAWPGFDTAVWELRNDQPGKLPRIRGTNADPTLGLSAQSSTVTCDVELNGDAGVSGFRYKVNDAANDTEYSGVFTVNLLDKLEIEPTIRTGYAFAQWSDGKTDNPYTMAVPGAVSLTAQTQIETYTIDYELNGGALEAGKTNPATYTLETAAFRLEEPTRTGYTFAGWTGSNGTTPQTDVGIAQGSTGSLYFEANWTANGYKILYTGVDGADVSTFPTKHVFGTDTAIPNPTKTGYGFAGWKVNGSAATRDLTLSGTAYTADITLEATWTANEFTITYSGVEGADVSKFPTKHVFGTDTAIPNPTKTGYGFAGWKVNGSAAARDLTLSGTAYTADITLEATWTANEFTITYSGVEGADVSTFPTKHVFGKDTAIPNPTKTGYGFAGWKVNGSAAARDLTLSGTAYTADITLEATWTKLTEPTPSVIMEGGTAFIVGKATEDAIMHIGKGVANFGVANLDYVDVDGKRLDPQFYTAKDGSILITVHQAYLNTLSVGEHILTAHLKGPGYEGQTVSGKIVVAPVPDMSNLPQTGDASPVLLWGATLGLCAAVLAVMKRKKK
ncbi:MAG: InlB B-repeat-containing protein [Christensenellales bacterium]